VVPSGSATDFIAPQTLLSILRAVNETWPKPHVFLRKGDETLFVHAFAEIRKITQMEGN